MVIRCIAVEMKKSLLSPASPITAVLLPILFFMSPAGYDGTGRAFSVAEAALDLGATPWQALTKVIIPQILPAIISGALIAFSMSFDDFVISFFTAGVGINNISMYVYSMKRYNPGINALSTLIVVVVTVILILVNVLPVLREKRRKQALAASQRS